MDGAPSAATENISQAVLDAIARGSSEAERRQLATLLTLWDNPAVTAACGAGFRRYCALSQESREHVLLSWADSRLAARRAIFQGLRKAVLLTYYMMTRPEDDANPLRSLLRYPGPLGRLSHPPAKALKTLSITNDTILDCDVCIVGSGAGGGTAAAVLAGSGLDTVVLEAGDYYDEGDFDGAELDGYRRLYLDGGATATDDQGFGLLAGRCLGGGTVINYTTCFRTPDEVREEWAAHGVAAFRGEAFTRSLDAVSARLSVNQDHNRVSRREQVLRNGLEALGWHVGTMPRNVRGCDQGLTCGYCGYGCQLGAKQSVVKTWISDACAAGARLLVRTIVDRVVIERGTARGVHARTADGHHVRVRARAVVVACGALHTPVLLRRSGLTNVNIGKHLRLHPVTAVFGLFDEEIRPWEGTLQAIYSDEHRSLDGSYGVKYETTAVHPSLFAAFAPWRSALHHRALMARLPNLVPVGILLRDRDGGEVTVGRDSRPIVRYRLSAFDAAHVRRGVDGAAQILEAAGAHVIFSGHSRWIAYEPGRNGSRTTFLGDCDRAGWGAGRCSFYSFHLMGTARMGGSPLTAACNPQGETWEARRLYVCDASTFPSASGVNPMISIEAIAHMNASALASDLRR